MSVAAPFLRRFAVPPPPSPSAEAPRCELCAAPSGEEHSHLVDRRDRTLACACRACYLLFTGDNEGTRYQAVPEHYRYVPRLPVTEAQWQQLGVPVGLAFFFWHSALEQLVAFYPSPAGATESPVALAGWAEVASANPELGELAPDVEALLVNRVTRPGEPAGYEGFAVPIDACYRLVGLVRSYWRGFDGGEEAWQAIGEFLGQLRARSAQAGGGNG